MWHPLSAKVSTNFPDKRRSLGRYSSRLRTQATEFVCSHCFGSLHVVVHVRFITKMTNVNIFSFKLYICRLSVESRNNTVGIATAYWLNDQEIWVWIPVRQEFSLLHVVQTGCEAHPTSYSVGTGGFFPGGKVAGTWSWPLTSSSCWGQEIVGLYIHSPLRLHGIVLN
jgi:hypothetical protein